MGWIIVKDEAGNPVLDDNGKPTVIEIPDAIVADAGSQDEKKAAAAANKITAEVAKKVRSEESRKFQKRLDDEKSAREGLERQLKDKEEADKQAKLNAMPPDAQIQARFSSLEQEVARERGARLSLETNSTQQIRRLELLAYRERALRDVPVDVHHLVAGQSEEEIDSAVDAAVETYQKLEAKFRGAAQTAQAGQPGGVPQVQQVPVVAAPPPSPYYTQQPIVMGPGGFPTFTNPVPVPAPEGPGEQPLSELTSEEAVRSGRYSGELRATLLGKIKGGARYPGAMGSVPRHQQPASPVQYIQLPNGVMQPVGNPTGPVQHPAMAQPPPVQQQVPAPPQTFVQVAGPNGQPMFVPAQVQQPAPNKLQCKGRYLS